MTPRMTRKTFSLRPRPYEIYVHGREQKTRWSTQCGPNNGAMCAHEGSPKRVVPPARKSDPMSMFRSDTSTLHNNFISLRNRYYKTGDLRYRETRQQYEAKRHTGPITTACCRARRSSILFKSVSSSVLPSLRSTERSAHTQILKRK